MVADLLARRVTPPWRAAAATIAQRYSSGEKSRLETGSRVIPLKIVVAVAVSWCECKNATGWNCEIHETACTLAVQRCRQRCAVIFEKIHANGEATCAGVSDNDLRSPTAARGKLRNENGAVAANSCGDHR